MCDQGRPGTFRPGKKNAPSFIYEVLSGEPKFLPGRMDSHRQKTWKGIAVDEHIPSEALDELEKLEAIEMRSSCEGSGPERPTFLIVRFRGKENLEAIENFVAGMNAFADVRCGAERGAMGRVRVGITTPLWFDKDRDQFVQWWQELPIKIQVVLAVLDAAADMA